MLKSFDPNQVRLFVGPHLGPNCLQRISADNKHSRDNADYFGYSIDPSKMADVKDSKA